MIQTKQSLTGHLSVKQSLSGKINNALVKEYPELEDIEITPMEKEQNFKSEKYGYGNVKVKAIETEDLTITPTLETQIKEGLYDKVTVNAIETEDITITPSLQEQNFEGIYNKVNVTGITENTLNVTPTLEKQTFNGVYTKVDVNEIEAEDITITPSTEDRTKEGIFTSVTVAGDSNLIPENIAKDKVIFGVTGTHEGGESNYNVLMQGTTTAFALKTWITEINSLDTSTVTNMSGAFGDLTNLTKLPNSINTSTVTNMSSMFSGCQNLKTVPAMDTSRVTNMGSIFYKCGDLTTIPSINTSRVTSMSSSFSDCSAITECPELDLSSCTNTREMFYNCKLLQKISLKNTTKIKNAASMFANCSALIETGLDCDAINSCSSIFSSCKKLTTITRFTNLGKGYTSTSANNSSYTLNLGSCTKLTYDSLMTVLNGLYDLNLTYDVANGGTLYTQTISLGTTNKEKLTADELAIATSKGWTVS